MSFRWLVGKVGAAFLTLIFVLVFNFFLFRVMGDPTTQLAKLPRATPQEIAQLRASYGLDKPLLGQFVDYVGDTARLDLGISQRTRRPVWSEIGDALPWTLLLVGTGTVLAVLIGAWLGVIAATRRGTRSDTGLLSFSLVTYAAPEYWLGIILILLFAVAIPIFPAGQQVTPGEDERDRLRLDRGRLGVAGVRDSAEQFGRQPELSEGHGNELLMGALPQTRGPVRARVNRDRTVEKTGAQTGAPVEHEAVSIADGPGLYPSEVMRDDLPAVSETR